MPRSKDPSVYPRQFTTIARAVGMDGNRVELDFSSINEGLSLQNKYYAWVAAMRRIEDKCRGKELIAQEDQQWIDVLQFARKVQVSSKKLFDGTVRTVFENRDENELSRKLREALANAKRPENSIVDQDANKFFGKILDDLAQEGVFTPATAESGGAISGGAISGPIVPPMEQEVTQEVKDRLTQYGSRNRGPGSGSTQ